MSGLNFYQLIDYIKELKTFFHKEYETSDSSLSIIEQIMIKDADFSNTTSLTKQLETESLKFMNELKEGLKS